jgi:hypothetical protein
MRFDMWPSSHLLDWPTLRNQHFHRSNPPSSHTLYADSHSQQSLLGPFYSWRRFALMVSGFPPPSPSTYPAQMNSSPLTLTLIPAISSKHVTYLLSSSTPHLVPLLTSTLTLIFDSCSRLTSHLPSSLSLTLSWMNPLAFSFGFQSTSVFSIITRSYF